MVKGRNRGAGWFAIIDKDWPTIQRAFETWLSPENLNPDGSQKSRLQSLMPS